MRKSLFSGCTLSLFKMLPLWVQTWDLGECKWEAVGEYRSETVFSTWLLPENWLEKREKMCEATREMGSGSNRESPLVLGPESERKCFYGGLSSKSSQWQVEPCRAVEGKELLRKILQRQRGRNTFDFLFPALSNLLSIGSSWPRSQVNVSSLHRAEQGKDDAQSWG